eukprot:gene11370-biopygen497
MAFTLLVVTAATVSPVAVIDSEPFVPMDTPCVKWVKTKPRARQCLTLRPMRPGDERPEVWWPEDEFSGTPAFLECSVGM